MAIKLILRMETSLVGLSYDATLANVNMFFKLRGLLTLCVLDSYNLTGVEGSPGGFEVFGAYYSLDVEAFVEWLHAFEWQNGGGVVELISFEDGKATEIHTIRGEKQFQLLSWYADGGEGDPGSERTCALAEGTKLDYRAMSDRTECGRFISLRVGSPMGWPTCGKCSASLLKKMREGKL